uniref:Uncharacterized protein n=1 Tax=Romanomermis culicivorax TaxID=13658 RepID=A0A915I8B3_ROMCU
MFFVGRNDQNAVRVQKRFQTRGVNIFWQLVAAKYFPRHFAVAICTFVVPAMND